MSEIVKYSFSELQTIGQVMAKSEYFTDSKTEAQCIVKILAGQECGISPFAAVNGIHIIHGKPAMGSGLIASRVKASSKYDFKVRELSNKVCRIEFFEGQDSLGFSEFTAEDAQKAGTQNMGKFPRNMLYARAISNGVRWYCPDVFNSPVYTPEELGEDSIEAEVIQSEVDGPADSSSVDWELVKSLTGFDSQSIASIATENGLPASPSALSEEQAYRLRNLVFLAVYASEFNHIEHAKNAYAKHCGHVPKEATQGRWDAWHEYNQQRNSQDVQTEEPVPALD